MSDDLGLGQSPRWVTELFDVLNHPSVTAAHRQTFAKALRVAQPKLKFSSSILVDKGELGLYLEKNYGRSCNAATKFLDTARPYLPDEHPLKRFRLRSDNLKGLNVLKEMVPPDSMPPPRTIYGGQFFHREIVPESESIQKLAHFADCVHSGIFPDGAVLRFMADAIQAYLKEEAQTLEEAFSLKSVKGMGNAAKSYRLKCESSELFSTISQYQSDQKLNQEKAIFNTLELHEIDVVKSDALKKKFQRSRKNKKLKKQQLV